MSLTALFKNAKVDENWNSSEQNTQLPVHSVTLSHKSKSRTQSVERTYVERQALLSMGQGGGGGGGASTK